ncbi:MAG: hypothetical protein CMF46_05225 [Legionellales bacterium]|nr:hypothetical protein [Legionellales bacterium]
MIDTVAIIGSGPVGQAAALIMSHLGYAVELIAPTTRDVKHHEKPIVLSLSTYRILTHIGMTLTRPRVIKQVRLSAQSRMQSLTCRVDDVGEEMLGCAVTGADLCSELNELVNRSHLIQRIDGMVASIDDRQRRLTLDTGYVCQADLVIAADGQHSTMRRLLAIPWVDSGHVSQTIQMPVTCREPLPCAELRLLRHGTVALIPSVKQGQAFLMWVHTQQAQPMWEQILIKQCNHQLFKYWPELEAKLISCDWQAVSQYQSHRRYALSLVRPGVVLVGDAAMTWEPVGAQMFNLAMADLAYLHDCLSKQTQPGTLWSKLARYQKHRQNIHQSLRKELSYLASLGSVQIGTSALISMMDCPGIKTRWMRKAMGYRLNASMLQQELL